MNNDELTLTKDENAKAESDGFAGMGNVFAGLEPSFVCAPSGNAHIVPPAGLGLGVSGRNGASSEPADPQPEAAAKSTADSQPEAAAESTADSQPEAAAEGTADSQPEAAAESTADPQPEAADGKPEGTEDSAPNSSAESAPEQPAERLSDMEVMEHTASIWRYNPVTCDGTEQHSESFGKLVQAEAGTVVAARVRGKKHKHEGTNCDDFFEIASGDGFIVSVVCDGAGSKPLSRIGARVSCEASAAYLKSRLSELLSDGKISAGLSAELGSSEFLSCCTPVAQAVQQAAREALCAQMKELKRLIHDRSYCDLLGRYPTLADLSCTFLAAAAVTAAGAEKTEVVVSLQIGDGCICLLDKCSGGVKIMCEPDRGSFSGETEFLSEKTTMPEAIAPKTRISRGNGQIIMLMTDGVADDYFPAEVMMKRLYLDLCMNGAAVLTGEKCETAEPIMLRAVSFPSISAQRQSVPLVYTKQLLQENLTVDEVWEKRMSLQCSEACISTEYSCGSVSNLLKWLDNYNERGSFDDRTLVLVDTDVRNDVYNKETTAL